MRLALFLLSLYPSAWRARYGNEIHALLEDTPTNFRTHFDLLKGALKMQLSVRSFPRLAALLSLTGLVLAYTGSYLMTPRYSLTAVLRYYDDPGVPSSTPEQQSRVFQQEEQEILSRTSLSEIIRDPRLDLYRDRILEPVEDVVETMRRRDLHVAPIKPANATSPGDLVFSIRYTGPDPHKAQMVVQALITRFRELRLTEARRTPLHMDPLQNSEIERLRSRVAFLELKFGIAPDSKEVRNLNVHSNPLVEVVDPPSLPQRPAKPNRIAIAAVGFIAGFLLASLITVARFTRRPTPTPVVIA